MAFEDVYRIIATQAVSVISAGGATVSTAVLGAETFAIELVFPGSVSSTGGCRFLIGDAQNSTVSSTTSAYLPANWIGRWKCTPGQRVYAKSNDGGAFSLTIMELSK